MFGIIRGGGVQCLTIDELKKIKIWSLKALIPRIKRDFVKSLVGTPTRF
jgi:hypothetical protein